MADENVTVETPDYLGMSDEDFAKLPVSAFDEPAESEVENEESEQAAEASADADSSDYEAETDDEDGEEDGDDDQDKDESASEGDDAEGEGDQGEGEESSDNSGDPESDGDAGDDKADGFDYEEFHKKITGEFKANGRMMKIEDPEDAIRLMQMGADYNRKMAGMKPGLKVLKMLEKNKLLDESKLSYLIELSQGNPQAIAKLLADSKVDPMDIQVENAGDYKSADHSVDEREINLDEVLSDLQSSEHYSKLMNVVSKEWDDKSKQTVADEPQLLRVINDHMALGIYDIVNTEIENERMLGRLNGVSYLEAYRTVGDSIAARGGFAHLVQSPADSGTQKQTPQKVTVTGKKKDDSQRKDKRRAASPSKTTVAKTSDDDYNPLSISDEEFEKRFANKFL